MPWLLPFLAAGLFIWTAVTIVWTISLIIRDSSIVDIFWGLGFVALYWFIALFWLGAGMLGARQILLGILLTIWGLRLSIYRAAQLGQG